MNKFYVLMLIGSTALTSIFNFLSQVLIARNTNPNIYGIYSIYNTLLLMSIPLVTFGMGHYLIKINSENLKNKQFLTINHLTLIIFSSLLGFIFIFIFLNFYFIDISIFNAFLMAFGVLSYAYFELFQSYLIGIQNRRFLIIWQPYLHFLRCLVLLFLIYIINGIYELKLISYFTISFSCIIFLSIWFFRNTIIKFNRNDYSQEKIIDIFQKSIWYGLVGFLYVVYTQLSVILISHYLDTEWAGYYNIGITFVLMSLILPNTLYYKYLLPKLHFYMKKNKKKLRYFYFRGALYSFIFGIFISIVLFNFSNFIILVFYGEKYLVAISLFKAIILVIPLFYLNIHLGVFTLLGDFQKYKFYVLLLVTLVSVVLNMILISFFGAFGAVYSLFLVLLIMAFAYYYVNKKYVLSDRFI